ncbi:hypothetical protein DPMN_061568, partial [Dreissena polymorpha]
AVPAPARGALAGYCIESEDCKANECCVSFNRYSVVDLSPDLKRFVEGKCEPLGGLDAGAFCSQSGRLPPRVDGPGLGVCKAVG